MTQQASIRTQLIDNLCSRLVDGDNVKEVFRSMTLATQAEDLPVCAVQPIEEVVTEVEHESGTSRALTLHIIFVAAKTDEGNASMDQIIDSALVWIEQKVTEDQTLGGLGFASRVPRIQWQLESGEFGFVGAIIETQIEYFALFDPSVSNR